MGVSIIHFSFVVLELMMISSALCGHHDAGHRCRFARDPYKVWSAHSGSQPHSRQTRQAEDNADTVTDLVHKIEDLHRSNSTDPAGVAAVRARYCEVANFLYREPECDGNVKFRTMDGTCNNLENTNWGSSNSHFRRLLPADYADGVSRPREFTKTAREVSDTFVDNSPVESAFDESELLVHMGQFLDHDMNIAAFIRKNCSCGSENDESCLPIPCSASDGVCGDKGCIQFSRSLPLLPKNIPCDSGDTNIDLSRAQLNEITSFIDGSNIYGSDEATEKELRMNEGGLLRTSEAGPLSEEHIGRLPPDKENPECITGADPEVFCGKGGDIRAAEQPALTALHTLFLNEHNRIASELAKMNSHWDDDRLYNEARKIVGALLQRIVYTEWLPLVLGKNIMKQYHLSIWEPYQGYDETLDPSITTDFATAFLRFGHSMVPEELTRVDRDYEDTHDDILMRHAFFNATVVHVEGGISSLLLGTLVKGLLKVDRHFSESVNLHLFENSDFGLDLVALNIQRGRDHGLPSWLEYRKWAFPDEDHYPTSFDELRASEIMDPEAVDALELVYSSVDEIEPFVGAMAEKHLDGALVGGTLANVLGWQFHKLKHGDRFWYENTEGPQAFSEDQITSINCVTMARVICDNINIDKIQPAAFKLADNTQASSLSYFYTMINKREYPSADGGIKGFTNQYVTCNNILSLPRLNLEHWGES